jgi:hypothetical protein
MSRLSALVASTAAPSGSAITSKMSGLSTPSRISVLKGLNDGSMHSNKIEEILVASSTSGVAAALSSLGFSVRAISSNVSGLSTSKGELAQKDS